MNGYAHVFNVSSCFCAHFVASMNAKKYVFMATYMTDI